MNHQIMTPDILWNNLAYVLSQPMSTIQVIPDETIPNLFTIRVERYISQNQRNQAISLMNIHIQPVDIDQSDPLDYTAVWLQPKDDEEPMPLVQGGDLAYTPYSPVGIVRVIRIFPSRDYFGASADIHHLHNHKGYANQSRGAYPLTELQKMILPPDVCERLGINPA